MWKIIINIYPLTISRRCIFKPLKALMSRRRKFFSLHWLDGIKMWIIWFLVAIFCPNTLTVLRCFCWLSSGDGSDRQLSSARIFFVKFHPSSENTSITQEKLTWNCVLMMIMMIALMMRQIIPSSKITPNTNCGLETLILRND